MYFRGFVWKEGTACSMIVRGPGSLCMVVALACSFVLSGRGRALASEHPSALLVYRHAMGVKYRRVGEADRVSYRVRAQFPASGVIGWISYRLDQEGWQASTRDLLNPDLPSSEVGGWERAIDATTPTEFWVRGWVGTWKDKAGNAVRYSFSYRYPKNGPADLANLHVMGEYFPARVVRLQEEAIKEFNEQQKRRRSK